MSGMYNTDLPTRAELPTTRQLIRSTLIALAAAALILITIVLPAEYGIDPTRIGRLIGLAEMGEIKQQLAKEAEEDLLRGHGDDGAFNGHGAAIAGLLISPAAAHEGGHGGADMPPLTEGTLVEASKEEEEPPEWRHETVVVLKPGEGKEIKLVMLKDGEAVFIWKAAGGLVNYDLHGDGGKNEISYEKGRGVAEKAGTFKAAFDGNHGWFWRNRDTKTVTITLKTRGAYSEIKRFE